MSIFALEINSRGILTSWFELYLYYTSYIGKFIPAIISVGDIWEEQCPAQHIREPDGPPTEAGAGEDKDLWGDGQAEENHPQTETEKQPAEGEAGPKKLPDEEGEWETRNCW